MEGEAQHQHGGLSVQARVQALSPWPPESRLLFSQHRHSIPQRLLNQRMGRDGGRIGGIAGDEQQPGLFRRRAAADVVRI